VTFIFLNLTYLLNMMFSDSIHLPVNNKISFFFMAEYSIVCVCVNHILLIQISVVGHLVYFHNLAIVNSATINMGVHPDLHSFRYIPRSLLSLLAKIKC
jgi:hypothetical protein